MKIFDVELKQLQVGSLKIEIHRSPQAAGEAAARAVAGSLLDLAARKSSVGVIFATGASQLATLQALTAMPDVPWGQVAGFHMDEYLGIAPEHPASFRG
ncbi:MAG: glucosamine-6-phosphate deaminase, partial [Terriglobia bacterium]